MFWLTKWISAKRPIAHTPSRLLFWPLALFVVMAFIYSPAAHAHGTEIDLTEVNAVEIQARFDSGEPMANAQVAIYAPTDQVNPWLMGEADDTGHFVFVPDRTIAGQWDVQIRTAGHGDWVYIDIAEGSIAELKSAGGGFTIAQIVLMSAATIWGLVGTALYFMGGKKEPKIEIEEVAIQAL